MDQLCRAGLPRSGFHRRAAAGLHPEPRAARARHRHQPAPAGGLSPADRPSPTSPISTGDNKPFARDDRRRLFAIGNRLWHSDSSFKVVPAKYSLLHARSIPSKGGNTEFADMRAAYDALDQETKDLIEPISSASTRRCSRAPSSALPISRPRSASASSRCASGWCACTPARGRKSLYLSSHAGTIIGWPEPEAKALLMDLTEAATQREFVYSHKWRVGDLVMWDNRADHAPRPAVSARRAARRQAHDAHGRRARPWRSRRPERPRAPGAPRLPGHPAAGQLSPRSPWRKRA